MAELTAAQEPPRRRGVLELMADTLPSSRLPYTLGYLGRCVREPLRFGVLRTRRFGNFLRRSARWPKRRLEAYQTARLRHVLRFAGRHVPYYQELFRRLRFDPEAVHGPRDLRQLPVLTREQVRANQDRLVARHIPADQFRQRAAMTHTSGSSGTPLVVYQDRGLQYRKMAFSRFYLGIMGLRRHQRLIKVWSRPFIENGQQRILMHHPYIRMLSLSSVPRQSLRVTDYLDAMSTFRPAYVAGPPSFLYHLAQGARRLGRQDVRFGVFMACFENLFPFQRRLIEEQFACEAFRFYSSEEDLFYAVECSRHQGLHVDVRKGVMEVLDDSGEPVLAATRGRIVATGLHNEVMPLVRYDMGDLGSLAAEPCPCGLGLPLLATLDGRTTEALRLCGRKLFPATLSVVLEGRRGIQECQFVRQGPTRMLLRVVPLPGFAASDEQALAADLRTLVHPGLEVSVDRVQRLPRTAGGKSRLVVDEGDPEDRCA